MRLAELAAVAYAILATRARAKKRELLAELLLAASPEERPWVVAWLSGELPAGKLGVGWAELSRLDVLPADNDTLTLAEVEAALAATAGVPGRGATFERRERLIALFMRATVPEQSFLRRLLRGQLRQGGLDGLVIEAVAEAAAVDPELLRREVILAGDLPSVAALVLSEGAVALGRLRAAPFSPLQPMLAAPSDGLRAALVELGGEAHRPVLLEWMLDGARVQVHRDGAEVRVYTRSLVEVSAALPEVVAAVRRLPVRRVVLDGEVLSLQPDGRPRPFAETQARFVRTGDVEPAPDSAPLSVFFFDLLLCDDELLLDRPQAERRNALARIVPAEHRLPALETSELDVALAFVEDAVARGHQGVVVKALDAPYFAGGRGRSWQKVKRGHTLELVVLAAEWGSGRRRSLLTSLHIGARDPAGGFVFVGKTSKGITEELLRWQTEALLSRELERDGNVLIVRPELVVEVAFDGVQVSTQHPAGLALRGARVERYPQDHPPSQAAALEEIRALLVRARTAS